MNKKTKALLLVILGVYFVLFHTAPFPLNHEVIGLPPFHTVHTIFGVALLVSAFFVRKKK